MSYFKGDCKVKVLNKNSLLEEKKISDIKVRDTIVSWDDLAEEWTYSKVKEIYSDKKLSDFCEQNIELGYEGIGYFSINSDKTCLVLFLLAPAPTNNNGLLACLIAFTAFAMALSEAKTL